MAGISSESCKLCPDVFSKSNVNGDGTSPSKLFQDLIHYSGGDREFAKKYWAASRDERITEEYPDIKRDENGEPTFEEVRKIFKFSVDEEKLLETLNKDLNKGFDGKSYNDAIMRVTAFNRNNPYSGMKNRNNPFIATIKQEGGKFKIEIVRNTSENRDALVSFVGHRNLQERIMMHLAEAGVTVNFLDDPHFAGRYSTENAEKTADGFWELISAAKGEKGDKALAEEAGHFAVAALGNHPLVTRLQQLLTNEELQQAILGDAQDVKLIGGSMPRELAGVLVGQAISNDADISSPIQRAARGLAARVLNVWKNIISRHPNLTAYRIQRDKITAMKIADKIARGFMSPHFMGDVDTALETKETLFDDTLKNNVVVFNKISNQLNAMATTMKGISSKLFKSYGIMAASPQLGRRGEQQINYISAAVAADGIAESLFVLTQQSSALMDKMMTIQDQISNITDFAFDQRAIAKNLREVGTFLKYATNVINLMSMYQNELNFNINANGKIAIGNQYVDPKELTNDLTKAVANLTGQFTKQKNLFYARFLEEVNGSPKIIRRTRIIFDNWKLRRSNNGKDKEYDMEELISTLDNDIDDIQRWLMSIQDSDIITQLHMKAIQRASREADDGVLQTQDELFKLQSELKEATGSDDTSRFVEISPRTGKPTGNFISQVEMPDGYLHSYVWGDWEDDYNNWKKDYKKAWFKRHEKELAGQSDIVKSALYFAEFKDASKQWHKLHSQFNKDMKRWMPSEAYSTEHYTAWTNECPQVHPDYQRQFGDNQYNQLSQAEKEWLYKYTSLKRILDSNLPVGSTCLFRLPQVRANVMTQFKNRLKYDGKNLFNAAASIIHENFINGAMDSQFDTDFGSDNTYNDIDDDPFANSFYVKSKVGNRVPLYFINKIKKKELVTDADGKPLYDQNGKKQYREVFDIDNVSTDLFHSTLAYADMALHHEALSEIVDAFELARDILLDREIQSKDAERVLDNEGNTIKKYTKTGKKESERISTKGESRAYSRYKDMMEKNLYNINIPKREAPFGFVWNKIVGALTRAGSAWLLGGHPVGGLVNFNTGFIEMLKESTTGEYFNTAEFMEAEGIFLADAAVNITQGIIQPVTGANVGFGRMTYVKTDKVSLFERFMNAREDNSVRAKHWYTRKTFLRHLNPLGDMLYMPYSAGDRNMQVVPYIAQAMHTKLYDMSGNEISLWKALKVHDVIDANGKVVSKELGLDDYYIPTPEVPDINPDTQQPYTEEEAKQYIHDKVEESIKDIKTLSTLLEKLKQIKEEALKNNNQVSQPVFSPDEAQLMQKMGWSVNRQVLKKDRQGTPYKETQFNYRLAYQVQNELDKLTFGDNSKAEFMEKCRQINNRMHGLYNTADKTGLQRTIIGNAITTMKGYVFGYITRKFAEDHYSVALGKNVEGSTVTYIKAIASLFQPIEEHEQGQTPSEKFFNGAKTVTRQTMKFFGYTFMPYSSTCKKWLKAYGFSDEQVINMRRSATDTYTFMILMALRLFLRGAIKAIGGDDDDKYRWFNPEGWGAAIVNKYENAKNEERIKILEDAEMSATDKIKKLNELAKLDAMTNMKDKEGHFKDDPISDAKFLLGLAYYFITRASLEQGAYSDYLPGGQGYSEFANVTGLMPASLNGIMDCWNLVGLMVSGERYKKNPSTEKTHYRLTKEGVPVTSKGVAQTQGDKYDDILKEQGDDYFGLGNYLPWVGWRATDAPKWKVKVMRRSPWFRINTVASDPRAAAESFDYNKYGQGQTKGSQGDLSTIWQMILNGAEVKTEDATKEEKDKKKKTKGKKQITVGLSDADMGSILDKTDDLAKDSID